MNPVSPIFVVPTLLIGWAICWLLQRFTVEPPNLGRFATIDGLRGYLALFVFLHHSSIWYFFLRSGRWEVPPSNLYTQLGEAGVALFFMITGFLFYTKLLDCRKVGMDWLRFFIGRLFRLLPLYLLALAGMLVIVMVLSQGVLHDTPLTLLKGIIRWLSFTTLGNPDLNGVIGTVQILAGVTWSLPYEWIFYLTLPILAMTVWNVPPTVVLAIGVVSLIGALTWGPEMKYIMDFLGGIIAALLVRNDRIKNLSTSPFASVVVVVLCLMEVEFFSTAYGFTQVALLTGIFVLIAGGADLFGILSNRVSRALGEMAYSIYLLHGLLLFITFRFVVGFEVARGLSVFEYWQVVTAVVPLLILTCFITYTWVERPVMEQAGPAARRVRNSRTIVKRVKSYDSVTDDQ